MAQLKRDGSDAVINLSTIEKIEGLLGSTRFPLAQVSSVEVLEDAHKQVEGWGRDFKLAGRYVPHTTAVGTFRNGDGGGITLALVHPETPRGLRLELVGEPYRCVVIGLPDPEATKAAVFGE
ncbi:hypothetical protein [Leifsonia sp. 1010]|uniref:hypothetical protein n=1 Tax=Leifsonia sp. 1010 TaxID=2817769 RepID=UPI002855BD17|nr:hypothetical protein [Leifsonia sp. 1010]MDR6611098.1 hypothetical protein [Leifsonia sp. 1010]